MKQIKTLAQLKKLASERRAVVSPKSGWMKPRPAAFIMCMQGNTIYQFIERGLFVYSKPKPSKES